MQTDDIRKILRTKADKNVREHMRKFVPTAKKIYGVKVAELNKLASKYKSGGFDIVECLWSDYLEERLLAAKILGRVVEDAPSKTARTALKLIVKFASDVEDWATCDTLATQAIRPIVKLKQKEIVDISKRFVRSKNPWKRRFGVVLLINFKNEKSMRGTIKNIIKLVEDDEDYYVRKAVGWVKRSIKER